MYCFSSVEDLDESLEDDIEEDSPLFVYLTCSVRLGRHILRSIAVKNLPMCLGKIVINQSKIVN